MDSQIVIPPIPESKKPIELLFIQKKTIYKNIDSLIYLVKYFKILKS